jgi:chaperone required for assembly of F1-ATPase
MIAGASSKRSYTQVGIEPAASGFAVTLDAKPLKTPRGKPVVVPTRGLAEAVAAEWAAQKDIVRRGEMPLTQLAGAALDIVPAGRPRLEADLVAYAETELVCHRAAAPAALVARQAALWQPLVDWLAQRFAAPLVVNTGVIAAAQPAASLAALAKKIAAHDDWRLAGLSLAVRAAGSLAIGLAVAEGRLGAAEAFAAAELDSTFQLEHWGEDWDETRRRACIRADLEAAARWFGLLG